MQRGNDFQLRIVFPLKTNQIEQYNTGICRKFSDFKTQNSHASFFSGSSWTMSSKQRERKQIKNERKTVSREQVVQHRRGGQGPQGDGGGKTQDNGWPAGSLEAACQDPARRAGLQEEGH